MSEQYFLVHIPQLGIHEERTKGVSKQDALRNVLSRVGLTKVQLGKYYNLYSYKYDINKFVFEGSEMTDFMRQKLDISKQIEELKKPTITPDAEAIKRAEGWVREHEERQKDISPKLQDALYTMKKQLPNE